MFVFSLIFPVLTGKWAREKLEELLRYYADSAAAPAVTMGGAALQFFYQWSARLLLWGSSLLLVVIFFDTFFWQQPLISGKVFILIWILLAHVCLYCVMPFVTARIDKHCFGNNYQTRQKIESSKGKAPQVTLRYLRKIQRKVVKWLVYFKVAVVCVFILLYAVFPLVVFLGFLRDYQIDKKTKALGLKFKTNKYIAYNPTTYNPAICDPAHNVPVKFPMEYSVRKDLKNLRAVGFTGLLTFSTLGPESRQDYVPPVLYQEEVRVLKLPDEVLNVFYTAGKNGDLRLREGVSDKDRRKLAAVFRNKFISLSDIPAIAKEEGFDSVIVGIWHVQNGKMPDDSLYNRNARLELANAVSGLSRGDGNVDAYCVGHNQLNISYDIRELKKTIRKLRKAAHKPVSTTQPVMDYYTNPELFYIGDWFCPDIHGYWYVLSGIESENGSSGAAANAISKKAGEEILSSVKQLQEQFLNKIGYKPVLIKFIGFPSAGKPRFSMLAQMTFFEEFFTNIQKNTIFSSSNISFSYFDAFDTPWKCNRNFPEEAYIGFFTQGRQPKAAARVFEKYEGKK